MGVLLSWLSRPALGLLAAPPSPYPGAQDEPLDPDYGMAALAILSRR